MKIINGCFIVATTVNELNAELDVVVAAMAKTDHSSTSIRSASDLFRRFAHTFVFFMVKGFQIYLSSTCSSVGSTRVLTSVGVLQESWKDFH